MSESLNTDLLNTDLLNTDVVNPVEQFMRSDRIPISGARDAGLAPQSILSPAP